MQPHRTDGEVDRRYRGVFFSYLKESQQCSLHAGDAKPIFFESSIAGPRECQGLPAVYEPSADEMEVTADGGTSDI